MANTNKSEVIFCWLRVISKINYSIKEWIFFFIIKYIAEYIL
jgi:hypothetical protein